MLEGELAVFSIIKLGTSRRYAAHPDFQGEVPDDFDEPDVLQPAGTVQRREDGSFLIQLTTVPLNGLLVLGPSPSSHGVGD